MHLELINESSNNGGILATGKASLKQVFEQGRESQWTQLKSTSSGEPFGELKLNLTFNVNYHLFFLTCIYLWYILGYQLRQ